MAYGSNPFAFLVDTLFHLFTLALLLRFLLQAVRANFYNPVSQALVRITQPVLDPFRKVVPVVGSIDLASLLAMFLVKLLGLWLVMIIAGIQMSVYGLLVLTLYQLLDLILLTFIVTILIQAVISWVTPGAQSPVTMLLGQINAPLLRPARRLIPPLGGLDLSPLAVLIALQFLRLALQSTLRWLF